MKYYLSPMIVGQCSILRSMQKKTFNEELHNCALHRYDWGDEIYTE
jgi:hypothetical protein